MSDIFGLWGRCRLTPLLGSMPPFSIASMTLPVSSATSRTQSDLPVATSRCVDHPLTCPYSLSSRSMSNLAGYFTVHVAQSWRQSSPSTAGSGFANRLSLSGTDLNPSCANPVSPTASVVASVFEDARETLEELKSEDVPRRKSCMVTGSGTVSGVVVLSTSRAGRYQCRARCTFPQYLFNA